MKKISRRSFLHGAAAASVAALAGCSTPSDVSTSTSTATSTSTSTASDASSDEKIIINAWTNSRHSIDYVTPYIDDFNAFNTSNIELVYEPMTENFDTNLDLAFQSGQAPDIYAMASGMYTYYAKDMAASLNDYVAGTTIEEQYGDTLYIEKISGVDGELYTIPSVAAPYRIVYNKEVLEAAGLDPESPPTTVRQMVDYAATITEKLSGEGIYGYGINLNGAYTALYRSADVIAQRSDAFIYDYDAEVYDFTGYMEVISYFREMYEEGYFFPGCEGLDIDSMRAQFADGKIGMYCSANWEVSIYSDTFPTDIDWAAAMPPSLVEGETYPVGVNGGQGWALSNQSLHPDEAFEVMSIFYDYDYQLGYTEAGYGSMMNPVVVENAQPATTKGSEYFLLCEDDVMKAAMPHSAGAVIEGESYWEVAASVIYGTKSIEDAIVELNDRYNTALAEAKASGVL